MRFTYTMALCLLVGLTSSVIADTISYSTPIPTADVGGGSTVKLPQFDPALGTLTGVKLYLDANAFAGSIAWDNESSTATRVTLGIGAEVTAIAPDALTIVVVPLQRGQANVDADNEADNGDADFIGTDALLVTGNSGSESDSATPVVFTPYIGTGTFSVAISSVVETYTSTTGGTGEYEHTAGQYDGLVSVTYTYDAVPEPTTMGLLACGGLAILYRRKRK